MHGYILEVPNRDYTPHCIKKIQGKLITPLEPPHKARCLENSNTMPNSSQTVKLYRCELSSWILQHANSGKKHAVMEITQCGMAIIMRDLLLTNDRDGKESLVMSDDIIVRYEWWYYSCSVCEQREMPCGTNKPRTTVINSLTGVSFPVPEIGTWRWEGLFGFLFILIIEVDETLERANMGWVKLRVSMEMKLITHFLLFFL